MKSSNIACMFLAAFGVSMTGKVNPIYIILIMAAAGAVFCS